MYPILGTVAGITVYSFTVTTLLAIVVATGVVWGEARRRLLPARLWWRLALAAATGGLAGAWLWALAARGGGLVWYGGLAGGALAASVVLHLHEVRWLAGADAVAPALALGLAIGRVGCHLAGDGDWGPPTSLPWGVRYIDGVAPWPHPPAVHVHPAALYEAGASLALFLLLRARPATAVFWWWCLLAGIVRYVVEVVRIEPVVAAGLTEAQLVSLALVVVGTVGLGLCRTPGRP